MKKIYTLAIALLGFSLFGTAQTFSIESDSFYFSSSANDEVHELVTKITTEATEALTLKWKITGLELPEGWEVTVCDNFQCYGDLAVSQEYEMTPFDSKSYGYYKVGINPKGIVGCGSIKILTYNKDNTDDNTESSFNYCASSVGIEDGPASKVAFFTNPVADQLQVNYNNLTKSVPLVIYTITGQPILTTTTSIMSNSTSIDVSSFQPGIYLLVVDGIIGGKFVKI